MNFSTLNNTAAADIIDDNQSAAKMDEYLEMPGMTKAVSIPDAPKAKPQVHLSAGLPTMIGANGDRTIPLPLLKLDKFFNEDEICCLTFPDSRINYKEKYISIASAITHCAHRVGDFGPGPSYSLYADKKCDDFKCDACYQQKDGDQKSGKGSKTDKLEEKDAECPAKNKKETKLELGQGIHHGTYKGTPIGVVIYGVGDPVGCLYEAKQFMRYTLVAPKGKQDLLHEFMEECLDLYKKMSEIRKRPESFCIYRWDSCARRWSMDRVCKARSMDTVILPEGVKNKITADLDTFLEEETAQWYQRHGLPYKRSYLFYGLPGTGKTSMITALAGKHKKNVCFVCLSDQKMDDRQLTMAFEKLPKDPFVVLEDIDSIFTKNREAKVKNFLTFSGLLNALDGIGYKFGAVFFMTTNFVNRLDSALLRAGRCDVKLEFTKAEDQQLTRYFRKFFEGKTEEAVLDEATATFLTLCKERFPEGVTMSTLQQHFINHMSSDAITCAKGITTFDVDANDQDGAKKKAAEEAKAKKEDPAARAKKALKEVKKFLDSLRLGQHLEALAKGGYDDMDTLECAEIQDFIDMGMMKPKARLLHKKIAALVKRREEALARKEAEEAALAQAAHHSARRSFSGGEMPRPAEAGPSGRRRKKSPRNDANSSSLVIAAEHV